MPSHTGFKWWYLLPLLCCLPLLCLPCLLCCKKKKFQDANITKPTRPADVPQKDLVSKESTKFVREKVPIRRGPKEEEVEVERTAIVEETHVVQKEVPVREVVRQPVLARRVR